MHIISDLDRKHSEVSKTVWMMSVSRTELIWQAETWEKIQPGSGKSEVCSFLTLGLSNTQWLWGHIAQPNASIRCQPSLEPCLMLLLWSGGEWEGNESEVCQRATSSFSRVQVIVSSVPLQFYRQRNSLVGTLLKMYVNLSRVGGSIRNFGWKACPNYMICI